MEALLATTVSVTNSWDWQAVSASGKENGAGREILPRKIVLVLCYAGGVENAPRPSPSCAPPTCTRDPCTSIELTILFKHQTVNTQA
jgi:hypothetical protein